MSATEICCVVPGFTDFKSDMSAGTGGWVGTGVEVEVGSEIGVTVSVGIIVAVGSAVEVAAGTGVFVASTGVGPGLPAVAALDSVTEPSPRYPRVAGTPLSLLVPYPAACKVEMAADTL